MADHTNYRSNPAEYLLELQEEGLQSWETIARAAIGAMSNDDLRNMMHANEIWPNSCGCGEYIADDESQCIKCKEAAEVQEFIDDQDEDEIDIEALKIDIENGNFDTVIQYDQVGDIYGKENRVQRSLADGQVKQAREQCGDYGLEFREQLIERLDRQGLDYDLLELPSWSLSAIVNGDFSGIDNQEDEDNVNCFLSDNARVTFSQLDSEAEGYFSNSPEFGLPTIVVEFVGVKVSN